MIVTRNRPELLQRCLDAVAAQDTPPGEVIVVDNASGPATQALLARTPGIRTLTMVSNAGGAGGFWVGIMYALHRGAGWLWLMDDDGRPADAGCLDRLFATAQAHRADMVGAMVVDVDRPDRLAFPVRVHGRTLFSTAELRRHGAVRDFAHLFNGVLIHANLFASVGLPDPRFLLRGDEVEFMYRARRAGAVIVLDTEAAFTHPGSAQDIHPIMFGRYYAVMPSDPVKQALQFRNRGYIFRKYRMWLWLAADVVRYAWLFLVGRRLDAKGLASWAAATMAGVRGRFMRPH